MPPRFSTRSGGSNGRTLSTETYVPPEAISLSSSPLAVFSASQYRSCGSRNWYPGNLLTSSSRLSKV